VTTVLSPWGVSANEVTVRKHYGVTFGGDPEWFDHTTMSVFICGCDLPFKFNAVKKSFSLGSTQMHTDDSTPSTNMVTFDVDYQCDVPGLTLIPTGGNNDTRVDASCSGSTRASRAATPLLSTANMVPEPADPRVEPYRMHTSSAWRMSDAGEGVRSKGSKQVRLYHGEHGGPQRTTEQ
jgi:hypothetical protein